MWLGRSLLTPDILKMLCDLAIQVCFYNFEIVLFKAVFSIYFFAALTVSELVPHCKAGKYGLQLADIIITDEVLHFFY